LAALEVVWLLLLLLVEGEVLKVLLGIMGMVSIVMNLLLLLSF